MRAREKSDKNKSSKRGKSKKRKVGGPESRVSVL